MGLTKRPDGYYAEFSVSDNGKILTLDPSGKLKRWKIGDTTKKIAANLEAVIKTRLISGQEPSPSVLGTSLTFNQLADKYVELEQVKRCRSESLHFQVKTLRKYFGNRSLSSITIQDILTFRASRAPRSIATINLEHSRLITMLNIARKVFGWAGNNVASEVSRPAPRNQRDTILSKEDLAALMKSAAPHLRAVVLIAYDCGARLGEILALKWTDLDMERREFIIRFSKNNESRVVPMSDRVYDAFASMPRCHDKVVTYKGIPVSSIRTAFRKACNRASIVQGPGGIRFHDLRHTAATNLRRSGVDTMTAMKIVGHKSEAMHRRYNTITTDDMHKAMAKLAASTDQLD